MKKLLLFIVFVFSLCSCVNNDPTREIINIGNNIEYEIITIDGCEYILGWDNNAYNGGYFLTHKGNCKNPIHYQNIVTVTDTIEYRLIKQE